MHPKVRLNERSEAESERSEDYDCSEEMSRRRWEGVVREEEKRSG
jgi:hypothetical protein